MAGPGLILFFVVFSALRDVYFRDAFHALDFFEVIIIAFSICTLVFMVVAVARGSRSLALLRADMRIVVAMNVATAVTWISYFLALKHLEPAAVNTLFTGIGSLVIVALTAIGLPIAAPSRVSRGEAWCLGGIGFSLALLAWGTISGKLGTPPISSTLAAAGVLLALFAGTTITISMLFTKRLHDQGVTADAVLATRFIGIVIIAIAIECTDGSMSVTSVEQGTTLAVAAFALIVLPIYAMQLGIARTTPLTAKVIASLGPVFLFGLQMLDDAIAYSSFTLMCVLLYAGFAIAANVVRARVSLRGEQDIRGGPAETDAAALVSRPQPPTRKEP